MTNAEKVAIYRGGAGLWRDEAEAMRQAAAWSEPGMERSRCEALARAADFQAETLEALEGEAETDRVSEDLELCGDCGKRVGDFETASGDYVCEACYVSI